MLAGSKYQEFKAYILKVYSNVTIKNIFNNCPKPKIFIESCVVRKPGSFIVMDLNRIDCYNLFGVIRFIFKGLICYELAHKNHPHIFKNLQVSSSLFFSRVIFRVNLGHSLHLNSIRFLPPMSHYPGPWIQYSSLEFPNDV